MRYGTVVHPCWVNARRSAFIAGAKIPIPIEVELWLGGKEEVLTFAPAPAERQATLADGVTGNTSDFGSEESRFETWSDNERPWRFPGLFHFGRFFIPFYA